MWLKRAASTTVNIASNIAMIYYSNQIATNSFSNYYSTGSDQALSNFLTFHPNNPDNPIYLLGSELQYAYNRSLSRKYAGVSLSNESLVMSKLDSGGVGMYRIDNNTGEEIDRLNLKDKNPQYIVDEYLRILYYFPNSKEIQVFSLN